MDLCRSKTISKEYADTVIKFPESMAVTNDMDLSFAKADRVSSFVSGSEMVFPQIC